MSTYVSPAFSYPVLLSARRRFLGLSIGDLAVHCRLAPETIERIEQDQFLPSPSQAHRLALALGLDPLMMSEWALTELLHRPEMLAEHVLGVPVRS